MTNNQKNNFLGQSKDLKSRFIEGILGLEVFSKMLEQAKKDYNDCSKKIDKDSTVIDELTNAIKTDERYREDHSKKIEVAVKQLKTEIDTLQKTVPIDNTSEINRNNDAIILLDKNIGEIGDKLLKAQNKTTEYQLTINSLTREFQKFNNIVLVCPTCKRAMADHNPDEINKEKANISAQIDQERINLKKLENAIKVTKDKAQKIKTEKQQLIDTNQILTFQQQKYNSVQLQMQDLQKKILNLESIPNPFEDKIVEQQNRLSDLQIAFDVTKYEFKLKEVVRFITSGQGVKATIVTKILDTLNERLEFYLKKLNSPHTCKFNEFFEETILNAQGKEISYGNASGGEAKRIDFALLFTFRDIRRLQSNIMVNLSIFDEIFDNSICENCLSDIVDLLTDTAAQNDECFYMITHRKGAIPPNSNVITLEKENGITKILMN